MSHAHQSPNLNQIKRWSICLLETKVRSVHSSWVCPSAATGILMDLGKSPQLLAEPPVSFLAQGRGKVMSAGFLSGWLGQVGSSGQCEAGVARMTLSKRGGLSPAEGELRVSTKSQSREKTKCPSMPQNALCRHLAATLHFETFTASGQMDDSQAAQLC